MDTEGIIEPGSCAASSNSLTNKIKLPETIQIGGTVYQIIIDGTLIDRHLAGELDEAKGQIKLSPEQCDHDKLCTLIHEALHAISRKYNIPLSEEQIEGLDDGLTQFVLQMMC
jgi:hypothetical protein